MKRTTPGTNYSKSMIRRKFQKHPEKGDTLHSEEHLQEQLQTDCPLPPGPADDSEAALRLQEEEKPCEPRRLCAPGEHTAHRRRRARTTDRGQHRQTSPTGSVEASHSGGRKPTPDGGLGTHKGVRSTGHDEYLGKYERLFPYLKKIFKG